MTELANAYPKKRFFIEMFTRDISLEECILDLMDNSIDGLVRSRGLTPQQLSRGIFEHGNGLPNESERPTIDLEYSEKQVTIKDTCGGIEYDYALQEAFNFGHSANKNDGHLGVYGIGLKRALFKLGDHFEIKSQTLQDGFSCVLDVKDWLKEDSKLEDWKIPLEKTCGADAATAGTSITVTNLHREVRARLGDGTLATRLAREIAVTYAFFLEKYVNVRVNGDLITPYEIPLAASKTGKAHYEELNPEAGVKVRIYASVAAPDERGQWVLDRAGWYVACNGRIVLHADQTHRSGWGIEPLPKFHPKFRQFIGIVFFEADDPHKLPWTTTKRGLNQESAVYLQIRGKMASAATPVLNYLTGLYSSPPTEDEPTDKNFAQSVARVSIAEATQKTRTDFTPPKRNPKTTTRVQYDAEKEDLDLVRKHLRRNLTAGAIGQRTFDYFLEQEGLK